MATLMFCGIHAGCWIELTFVSFRQQTVIHVLQFATVSFSSEIGRQGLQWQVFGWANDMRLSCFLRLLLTIWLK